MQVILTNTGLQWFAVCLLFVGALSQTPNQYCNDDMTACSCPEEVQVCSFELVVEQLLTFTRYIRNAPFATGGKAFFINDIGELVHIPVPPDRTGCNATNCTQANTADSRTYRSFIGINGRLPGPTLIVYEGQTLVINVVNMLQNEVTTIHWHGLLQFNTPWMDGAGTTTQCPIEPGTSFRYIFKADQAGTFWYHSHSGLQRGDGMVGALIIRDRSDAEKYPIDHVDLPEEHTITLQDWQREDAATLFLKALSRLRRFPDSNKLVDTVPLREEFEFTERGVDGAGQSVIEFWSALFNGIGRHPDVDFKNSMVKVFSVNPGKTYRFRIVGSMSIYAFRFSIDGHRLTVIATDGNYIEPIETDYVLLHSGERYDVLVTANQTTQSDFWMRVETLEVEIPFRIGSALPPYPPIPGHEGRAILHYNGSPVPVGPDYANITEIPKTCTVESPCKAVNCFFQDYHPSYNITCVNVDKFKLHFPTPPDEMPSVFYDEQYIFNFAFENRQRVATINSRTFISPKTPPLIDPESLDESSVCDLDDDCKDGCFCTHKIDIPFNKTIRFVFSTFGMSRINRRFSHPIHFHGHHFHVVGVGYGTYNETTGDVIQPTEDLECAPGSNRRTCIKPTWKNGSEPQFTIDEYTIRKDTVMLPALGYVVVHFKSTNPGWWLLHCHILLHQAEGMVLVINEAQDRQPPPPAGMCARGNFTWTVEDFNKALEFVYIPPTLDEPTNDDDDDGLSADAKGGIAVGVVVFLAICIGAVLVVAILLVAKEVWETKKRQNVEKKIDGKTAVNEEESGEMTIANEQALEGNGDTAANEEESTEMTIEFEQDNAA